MLLPVRMQPPGHDRIPGLSEADHRGKHPAAVAGMCLCRPIRAGLLSPGKPFDGRKKRLTAGPGRIRAADAEGRARGEGGYELIMRPVIDFLRKYICVFQKIK